MFQFLSKLKRAVIGATAWSNALDAASNGDLNKALKQLERAEQHISLPADMRPLKAYCLHRLGRYRDAVHEFENSLDDLDRDAAIRPHDKGYLEAYIGLLGREAAACGALSTRVPPKSLRSVELRKVSGHLKRHYPLLDHPDWPEHA